MSACLSRTSTLVDTEDALLTSVSRCSPTTTKTDVRCLHRKNAKAVRLAIELSEHEANKEVTAKAARHAKKQDRLLRRLSSTKCSFDYNLTNGSTSKYDGRGCGSQQMGRGRSVLADVPGRVREHLGA
ncbi:Polygalacturonase ADPG1 [Hordeum vulgare]|nr:Polygalacturonase ADPG1 [Hordeum vulgare]